MTITYKIYFLVKVMTPRYLKKYLFRKNKYNNILERDARNIYIH